MTGNDVRPDNLFTDKDVQHQLTTSRFHDVISPLSFTSVRVDSQIYDTLTSIHTKQTLLRDVRVKPDKSLHSRPYIYTYVYIKFTYTVEQAFSLLPFVFLPLKERKKKKKEGKKTVRSCATF